MKVTVGIDIGAKNTGFSIVIDDKVVKNGCIILDKNKITFSKISRRNNRHRVRNEKRRKLARRLLWEILSENKFTKEEIELINGLLKNRGYTYLDSDDDFEVDEELREFFIEEKKLNKFADFQREDFGEYFGKFENEKELIKEIDTILDLLPEKKYKEFKNFLLDIKKQVQTGAKHRKVYLKEIEKEIQTYDFIDNKDEFFNLIGNISNFQLRLLRKYFNQKQDNIYNDEKLTKLLKKYFKRFKNKDFAKLSNLNSALEFLQSTSPALTIPPQEEMDNRDPYRCNSMLIKEEIANDLKNAIKKLIREFDFLDDEIPLNMKLQRIMDLSSKVYKNNPRTVFKHQKGDIGFYKKLLGENFEKFSRFAKKYYSQEEKIINGIYDENFVFRKCNTHTPKKKNIRELLLKPIYSVEFTQEETDTFTDKIKQTKIKGNKRLYSFLNDIATLYKTHQNSFWEIIKTDDKDVKKIKDLMPLAIQAFDTIMKEMNKKSIFENIDENRFLNIALQTYNILFKDVKGFSKTCKHCSIENAKRSDENNPFAKRLLSDVSKPIDGILDFILDRIAFELTELVPVEDIDELRIVLEQNRFNFEESLSEIKGKKKKIKEFKEHKYCPYTGEEIKNGDYDHILPRSKELYNSKANLIYCSRKGNEEKGNKYYFLENLSKKHLKEIFKTEDLSIVKEFISKHIAEIDENRYTNFNNLPYEQKIAFRYALFMEHSTPEFKKAKRLLKQDKIKLISNGTQKRFARLIYEKLKQKRKINPEKVTVKLVDSKIISDVRLELSINPQTGEIIHEEIEKQEFQKPLSHAIDAMTALHIAEEYDFWDIYSPKTIIKNIEKRQTFINAKKIDSFQLFKDSIMSADFTDFDDKEIEVLKEFGLWENGIKKEKYFKLLFDLFENRNTNALKKLKFMDKHLFFTIRKDIKDVFFKQKSGKITELIYPDKKTIPPKREKIYKAIYNHLKDHEKDLFKDGVFNEENYKEVMQKLFKPTGKKRGKKRHVFSVPVKAQAKYIVMNNSTYRFLSNENIATKHYLINGKIVDIPYFSKNTLPKDIKEIIKLLNYMDLSKPVYEVEIKTNEISDYVETLKYYFTEKSRIRVIGKFIKSAFDVDFSKVDTFTSDDDEFKKFIDKIENDEILRKYLGPFRDNGGKKALLLDEDEKTITLKYVAEGIGAKKDIALKYGNIK